MLKATINLEMHNGKMMWIYPKAMECDILYQPGFIFKIYTGETFQKRMQLFCFSEVGK